MNLPEAIYQILIPVVLLSLAVVLVGYFTKDGKKLRSRANRNRRS